MVQVYFKLTYYTILSMGSKKSKVYQPKNLNSMARYLEISAQTLHWYKREKPKKFELLKLGWQEVCKRELQS